MMHKEIKQTLSTFKIRPTKTADYAMDLFMTMLKIHLLWLGAVQNVGERSRQDKLFLLKSSPILGMNLAEKEDLNRPWDIHAERLTELHGLPLLLK